MGCARATWLEMDGTTGVIHKLAAGVATATGDRERAQ
jgi:hypothetical protein